MELSDLKIDPEFQEKIPPLTEAEFEQLRENILEDGEVYEPITVWRVTILDGHNRVKIIQEHPELPYRLREMDFPDKWAAFDWMYKKQLGRRNLSKEQRLVMIGQMYEARKKSVGEHVGNQYTNLECDQNDHIPNQDNRTADAIASELGIGPITVRRAEKYSKGIDAIRSVSDEAANKILKGGSGVKQQTVMDFPALEPDEQKKVAEAIVSDDKDKETKKAAKSTAAKTASGTSRKHKRIDPDIDRIDAEARDPNRVHEYTLADMMEEMQAISDSHTSQLRRVLTMRSTLLNAPDARDTVTAFLCESISALDKLKGLVSAPAHTADNDPE